MGSKSKPVLKKFNAFSCFPNKLSTQNSSKSMKSRHEPPSPLGSHKLQSPFLRENSPFLDSNSSPTIISKDHPSNCTLHPNLHSSRGSSFISSNTDYSPGNPSNLSLHAKSATSIITEQQNLLVSLSIDNLSMRSENDPPLLIKSGVIAPRRDDSEVPILRPQAFKPKNRMNHSCDITNLQTASRSLHDIRFHQVCQQQRQTSSSLWSKQEVSNADEEDEDGNDKDEEEEIDQAILLSTSATSDSIEYSKCNISSIPTTSAAILVTLQEKSETQYNCPLNGELSTPNPYSEVHPTCSMDPWQRALTNDPPPVPPHRASLRELTECSSSPQTVSKIESQVIQTVQGSLSLPESNCVDVTTATLRQCASRKSEYYESNLNLVLHSANTQALNINANNVIHLASAKSLSHLPPVIHSEYHDNLSSANAANIITELEIMLKRRDWELSYVRFHMQKNVASLNKALQDANAQWMFEVQQERLRANQLQHSLDAANKMIYNLTNVQNTHSQLVSLLPATTPTIVSTLHTEETIQRGAQERISTHSVRSSHSCSSSSAGGSGSSTSPPIWENKKEIRTSCRGSKTPSASSNHKAVQSEPLPNEGRAQAAMQEEIHRLQTQLREQLTQAACERVQWLQEKTSVLQYQHQLQEVCQQLTHRCHYLQSQLEAYLKAAVAFQNVEMGVSSPPSGKHSVQENAWMKSAHNEADVETNNSPWRMAKCYRNSLCQPPVQTSNLYIHPLIYSSTTLSSRQRYGSSRGSAITPVSTSHSSLSFVGGAVEALAPLSPLTHHPQASGTSRGKFLIEESLC